MNIPSDSKRVLSVDQLSKYFTRDGLQLIHVAAKRTLNYYHHYVILAKKSVWNSYLKIVQYTGGPAYYFTGSTCGEVEESITQLYTVEQEISKGLYVITGSSYPQSAMDFVNACARYLIRLGERAYHFAYNNCEHLAKFIMNGKPKSEQIEQSGSLKKGLADTLDMAFNDGKSNIAKTALATAGSTLAARKYVRTASKQVLSVSPGKANSNIGRVAGTTVVAHNLIKYTASRYPTSCSAQQMLCSELCCEVAETAGKTALKKTAVATGVLTVVVETGFAAWQINNLRNMRNAGKILDRDFKRETAKAVVTVPVVSAFTTAGSVIGQALCPVPYVGAFLGGLAGNVIGRWGAGVVTGRIFDWWWP
ncbi:uncharacterized protein [Mytilus edulis]|uniref:uncharacterized protein n=1 Tax=Mytilus edulis TaxID=6550 RepID=UPI0039F1402B